MAKDRFFVILHDQHGGALAMTNDFYGAQMALFDTYEEADKAGSNNMMGEAWRYEIHSFGKGGCVPWTNQVY